MVQVRSRLTAVVAVLAVAALAVAGTARGAAQDATPMAGMAMAGMPNHIHTGTCENLGEIVAPLADLQYTNMGGGQTGGTPMAGVATPMASPMAGMATPMAGMMGATAAVPVAVATTQVPLALSDILAGQHAINVHESAANIQRYIACGAIGGTPDAQGNLFVGLQEQNGSGFSGVAWLLDNGGGAGTTVTVFLTRTGTTAGGVTDMATPMATPIA